MVCLSLPFTQVDWSAGQQPGKEAPGKKKRQPPPPKFDSQVVTHGASLTWRNYVKWWNKTQGTPLGGDRELAPDLWGEGVADLKPEYVYTHGVNLVIVRSLQDGDEEGFYVALGISSGPGPNDKQFMRILIAQHAEATVYATFANGVWDLERLRKGYDAFAIGKRFRNRVDIPGAALDIAQAASGSACDLKAFQDCSFEALFDEGKDIPLFKVPLLTDPFGGVLFTASFSREASSFCACPWDSALWREALA